MTGKKWILVIVATALVSVVATLLVQRRLQSGPRAEARSHSVHLPPGYDRNVRYPVLYVLDGGSQAAHTAESAATLARIGVMHPIIVVGINGGDTRDADYTPPEQWQTASPFLSFLQSELIPRVEAQYPTTRPRMLAGWSRGGTFVLYSQIAAPSLFDARFAHSPFVWSEEDERAASRFEEGLPTAAPAASFLYLSLGERETQTMPSFRRAVRALETRAPKNLRWKADLSPGGDHGSNPRLSAPIGLCAMFGCR